MTTSSRASLRIALVALPAAVAVAAVVQPARTAETTTNHASQDAEKGVDPQADRMLKAMADYLASLQSFTVRSAAVDEVVTKSGRKVQIASDSQVSVERPNRLRSEQLASSNAMAFWYDGKTMTLYCSSTNTYGTSAAPPTLDDTIDLARKKFRIEAPGADLLFSHPYDILMEQVTAGQVLGRETIDGIAANHLAFEGHDVDWQVWIQDGTNPLPLRFEITTKTVKSQPEFSVQLSHWKPQAKIEDSTFVFQPPPGAKRVESLPASCPASP
jgi:hypothetical protein